MNKLEESMRAIYGSQDLAAHPFFQGGFINFGYWKDIPITHGIEVNARISASRALYECLLNQLNITAGDTLLEVGCGHGLGCALICERWHPASVIGIDLMPEQVERANENLHRLTKNDCSITFRQGRSDALDFPADTFTKIYTVEAAQHFPSIPKFLEECWRTLKPNGQLGITTFFAESTDALEQMRKHIPELDLVMNPISPLSTLTEAATKLGYKINVLERIGEHVFPGFQKWVELTKCKDDWGPIWEKAYELKLHDYFIIVLQKQ
ncbi:MAG: methyltransferase domain-containing protein [Cyanobacteria bacterium SZAS LIN-5]|nr:methyltransferase domain-containing protein [Cyanobacteria bacterium SZAS LIN-5]